MSHASLDGRNKMSRRGPFEHSFVSRLKQSVDSLVPLPSTVVLAVSGGADSIALMRGWLLARAGVCDQLVIATFDHELRGDSNEDARFVAELAKEMGLVCEMGRPASPLSSMKGESLEGTARTARYEFLREIARKHQAAYVATAHTADDQAETILHRIIRGTGLQGLAGIKPKRSLDGSVELVRPMLELSRDQIEGFLADLRQPFRNDTTNDDRRFTRNRIRHELLPLLRAEFNPMVGEALCRLGELAQLAAEEENRLIQGLIARVVRERSKQRVYFDRAELCLLGEYQATSLIRAVMEEQRWPMRRMGKSHLTRIARLCYLDRSTRFSLPHGFIASLNRRQGVVSIVRETPDERYDQSTDESVSGSHDNP